MKMSGVCDNRVDGNIEIPSGGTPQDVHVFKARPYMDADKWYESGAFVPSFYNY